MSRSEQRFIPARKIIPAEELGNILDGSQFARQAKAELGNIKRRAAETFEKAREQGYEEGMRRGHRDTLKALRTAVEEARRRLISVEDGLDMIVIEAVEKIIGTLDYRDVSRKVLYNALDNLAASVVIDIYVAPEDLAAAREDIENLDQSALNPEIRSVREDPLLKSGEIVISTPQGRIQAGVVNQINRLKAALQGAEE